MHAPKAPKSTSTKNTKTQLSKRTKRYKRTVGYGGPTTPIIVVASIFLVSCDRLKAIFEQRNLKLSWWPHLHYYLLVCYIKDVVKLSNILGYMWCFAQFGTICIIQKTRKKHGGVLLLVKLLAFSLLSYNFTKSDTPPSFFFTFFKLCKWYHIAQHITYVFLAFSFDFRCMSA